MLSGDGTWGMLQTPAENAGVSETFDVTSSSFMDDRGHLTTEHRNPRSQQLDRLSIPEAFDLINREDAGVAAAAGAARDDACRAIELVVAAFRAGGRLVYVGAGTSGRLGGLDATECPPTFLSDPQAVQGIIAGGPGAPFRSVGGGG